MNKLRQSLAGETQGFELLAANTSLLDAPSPVATAAYTYGRPDQQKLVMDNR